MRTQRTVFISRVSREFDTLAEELRSLLQAVGQAGRTQVAFRQEPDADTTLAKLSHYIRQCDIVLCLIGQYSGACPPDSLLDDPIHPAPLHGKEKSWRHLLPPALSKLSYTQWEVILARYWKKPLLIYFGQGHTPDHAQPSSDDDLSQQQQFITWLIKERGLDRDYFATADRLGKLVLRDLWPRKLRRALWITTGIAAAAAAAVLFIPRPDVTHVSQQVAAQNESLANLSRQLDEIKLDRAAAGQDFKSVSRDDLERLLAEKAEITVQELRRRIARGTASRDPIERARALVLSGEFDTALEETASLEKSRTRDLLEILTLKAQAHDGKFQFKSALAERQKIVALTDKTADPAAWAAAQHMAASSLSDLGQERDAETVLRDVIALRHRVLGPDHRGTLQSRNNLATVLEAQGKFAEAEAEHRLVVPALQRALGPEHPDALQSRNGLASVMGAQGKNAEAEAEYRSVLAVQERTLGPEHADTLLSRSNLAMVLGEQGKYAEEEAELRALSPTMRRVFGAEHPHVLSSRNNLAIALAAQDKLPEADAECRAVLAVQDRLLGPEHPDTLRSRNTLAVILQKQGAHAEAAAEYRAMLTVRDRVLGPEHPDTLLSRNNLATALDQQKNYADAEAEYRAVLAVQTRVLGPEHPDTIRTRSNLAGSLGNQKKYAEEEAEQRAALPLMERVFGPAHRTTLRCCFNLSACLRTRGNERKATGQEDSAHEFWRQALTFARRARDSGEQAFGKDHPFLPRFERQVTELEAKLEK